MASPPEKMLELTCPGCGGRFRVPVSLSGRHGQCARCGAVVVIAGHGAAGPRQQAAEKPPAAHVPQLIRVECRVCQTLMYGRPDQVGKRLKCPDCGAISVVPPPPKPKAKRMPAALEGDQLEVWEADQQPLPRDLIAAQPVYIAVVCRKCQTLMYATEDRVGQTMKCPDCGTPHVVPPPPPPSHREPLVLDGAYAVDSTKDPGKRPPVLIPPRRKLEFEEREEAEYARALEESRRTGKPLQIDARGHRVLPRWPLVTGVWRMLATEEVIARWILLSIVLGFAGQLLSESLLTPVQGQAEAIKLIFAVIGFAVAGAWLAMAGPLLVAVICDSAAGDDKVQQPPKLLAFDWFGELFSVLVAGATAGLCGLGVWQLVQLISLGPVASAASAASAAAVVLAVLPVALLSTLLESSPLNVVSARVLRSIRDCTGSWLLFYIQTAVLAALLVASWFVVPKVGPFGGSSTANVWILAPLAVAALLVYGRLLGRLAWRIAEAGS